MWPQPAPGITTRMSVDEWLELPEDLRCELVEGEVVVSPSPSMEHQRAVRELFRFLDHHVAEHGGEVFFAPLGVKLSDDTALEPDLLVLAGPEQYGTRIVEVPPDLVVEVSSPSTRRYDLVRKRELYERYGVPEFWFVDLDGQRIEVHAVGADGRYLPPVISGRGASAVSTSIAGFTVEADAVLPTT